MSPAADETCCSRNLLFPVVLKRTTRSRRPLAPPERAGACRGTHRVARRGFSRMTGCASHRDDGVARSERSVAMAISSSTAEASLGVDHPTGGRALREMVRRGTAFSWGLTRDQRRPRPALGKVGTVKPVVRPDRTGQALRDRRPYQQPGKQSATQKAKRAVVSSRFRDVTASLYE
jgi:hypothetical protein